LAILQVRPAQLAKELGISVEDAVNILKMLRNEGDSAVLAVQEPVASGVSALDLYRKTKQKRYLITLCEELDVALGGGVSTGQLTEFFGCPGIGKTQFGIQLACDVQIPSQFGGLEGQAVYIDTEGSFMPERVAEIAQALVHHLKSIAAVKVASLAPADAAALSAYLAEFSVQTIMSNIFVFRVFDHTEQMACIKTLPAFLASHPRVKLIVLDSVAFHFRAEFEDMSSRQRLLQSLAQDLLAMAEQNDLAVVLINQVTTKIGGGAAANGPFGTGGAQLIAALGESWAHVCTTRITLHWLGEQRCARIIKSPSQPDATVQYEVSHRGISVQLFSSE
jgi:RAD51-like protein 2